MAPLTLQALLASRGIYRPRDLAQVMEWSRQLAHVYWRGWTRRRRTPDGPLERVPVRLGREAATRLAEQIAAFPQRCMRSDRLSSYEQWSLSWPEATLNEVRRGMTVLASGETRAGATRFAQGAGRHGRFS